MLSLERRQLDLETGTLRLELGTTKNDEARTVYITPELRTMLAAQLERVDQLSRRIKRIVPYVFPHLGGRRRRGERRGDFRKAWETACKNAGVPGKLRHDFRRTAVRNMVNAGRRLDAAGTFSGTSAPEKLASRSLTPQNTSTRL